MTTRSPKTPCGDKRSESLCRHSISLAVTMADGEALPSCMIRCSTVDGSESSRSKTFAYCSSLHTCSSFRSALRGIRVKKSSYYLELKLTHLQSSMRIQAVGPMGARNEWD